MYLPVGADGLEEISGVLIEMAGEETGEEDVTGVGEGRVGGRDWET